MMEGDATYDGPPSAPTPIGPSASTPSTSAPRSITDDGVYEYECDLDFRSKLRLDSPHLEDGSIGSQALRYGDSGLDWNRNFQAQLDALHQATHVLRGASARKAKADAISRLAKLGDDFVRAAELYAKVIISEVSLPKELKTVRPLEHGNLGRAGGEKYIARGILLKLAIDDKGIYGGDDAAAAKVAGHELRSLCQIYHYSAAGLYFPMCATIDYLGYRVFASSILPISTKTLCYGSEDGVRVYNADEGLCALMKETCGNRLNLKCHTVQGIRLHAPTDLEGHVGHDGRYYIIDLSRLFPPTKPDRSLAHASYNSYLYRLFRPEFVRNYRKPLCSDAYSKFGGRATNRRLHDPEIDEATDHLKGHTIPLLAEKISNLLVEDDDIRVPRLLHEHGVNLRYGGLVWNELVKCSGGDGDANRHKGEDGGGGGVETDVDDASGDCDVVDEADEEGLGGGGGGGGGETDVDDAPGDTIVVCNQASTMDDPSGLSVHPWNAWLVVEMCARASKNDILSRLRAHRREHRSVGEEPYKQVVAEYLSSTFCQPTWGILCSQLKTHFHFGNHLTPDTLQRTMCCERLATPQGYAQANGSLPGRAAPLCFWFLRLEELGGFRCTEVMKELRLGCFAQGHTMEMPFVSEEIAFRCRVKHLSIIQYCKSVCYRKLVEEASLSSSPGRWKKKILGLALAQLEQVLDCVPRYAWALRCRAEVLEDMEQPHRAEMAYKSACTWGRGPSSHIKYALFLGKHGRHKEAILSCCKGLLKDVDNERGRKAMAVCLEENYYAAENVAKVEGRVVVVDGGERHQHHHHHHHEEDITDQHLIEIDVDEALETHLYNPLRSRKPRNRGDAPHWWWSKEREAILRQDILEHRIIYRRAIASPAPKHHGGMRSSAPMEPINARDDASVDGAEHPHVHAPSCGNASHPDEESHHVQEQRQAPHRRFSIGLRDSSSPELLSFIVDAYRRPKAKSIRRTV